MTEQAMKIVNGERKYFAIIPHIVDDMGLSVWAYRLYGHFRRVAGEDGGACWQSTRTLAEACKMSTGQVAKAKLELVEAGLITITNERGAHGDYHVITIADVWALNMARYSQTEQTETGERSPGERYRSPHERKRSPGETKKNPGRKTPVFSKAEKTEEVVATTTRFVDQRTANEKPVTGATSANSSSDDTPAKLTLREKVAAEIRKQDNGTRIPDMAAIDRALDLWGREAEGRGWKMTNIDAILERYDIVLQGAAHPRSEYDPAAHASEVYN